MQPEQQNPQISHSPQTPISHSEMKKDKGIFLKITVVLLVTILLAAAGGAGYLYYNETQTHDETKQELSNTQQTLTEIFTTIEDNAQVLQDARLEPNFRKSLQDGANRECSTQSAIIFNTTTSPEKNDDGSTKKFFAVGQYVCNNGEQATSGPIRFVAVQSYDQATWEFTYGSSTATPTSLPGYIFNTDPALFNRKYNNPQTY